MAGSGAVRATEFDTSRIESRHRIEAIRAALPFGVSSFEPFGGPDKELEARFRAWNFAGVTVGRGMLSGFNATCSKPTQRSNRFIDITKFVRGYRHFDYDGRSYEGFPGGINIVDGLKWERVTSFGPFEAVFAVIPQNLIQFDATSQSSARLLGRRLDGPTHELLDANLDILLKHLPSADATQAQMLTLVFSEVVCSLLSDRALDDFSYHTLTEGRAIAVRRYVNRNFAVEDLSVDQVCHACGVSRATLYRVFAKAGGFTRYVIDKRLAAAHEELSRSVPRRGLVREVAEQWGFINQAHFCRLFRERIGVSPSDVVGTAITTR